MGCERYDVGLRKSLDNPPAAHIIHPMNNANTTRAALEAAEAALDTARAALDAAADEDVAAASEAFRAALDAVWSAAWDHRVAREAL